MKVIVYPADMAGCGYHRLIWPAQYLRAQGVDVEVIEPGSRKVLLMANEAGQVRSVRVPPCDVFVLQRPTHAYMMHTVRHLRAQGIAVVVDIDDDLRAIHPSNPAFIAMHPKSVGVRHRDGTPNLHSWTHLDEACRNATMVTVSTRALLPRYAAHGRGAVLDNYLPDHHYTVPHIDSDLIGWPASIHSHPDDPSAVGNAIARLVGQGARFEAMSCPGAGPPFGLAADPPGPGGNLTLGDWPREMAKLGIGIAPLADTRFNAAKSRLKVLELSATGVPWVASPRAEYARFHAEGAGLLADRPKDWYRTLRRLMGDAALRVELAQAGRAAADRNRLRDHAWRWAEVWQDALKAERAGHAPLGNRRRLGV